jgi:hypothetical protein
MLIPSAFLARVRVKERTKGAKAIMAIEPGRVRTFQLPITLIRLPQHYTKPHLHLQLKTGGLNKNWDQLSWTLHP